jgi:hypothetical protein
LHLGILCGRLKIRISFDNLRNESKFIGIEFAFICCRRNLKCGNNYRYNNVKDNGMSLRYVTWPNNVT